MHALHDLAAKIEALAKEHEAYSQAQPVVQNCVDHLSAIARTHEMRDASRKMTNEEYENWCYGQIGTR